MAVLGSNVTSEVGLRLLLCPLESNIVVRTACCSVGIVVPVYSTFKAIERKDQNEQQKGLMHWAAYGTFSLVEAFADKLISWYSFERPSIWFPMYYHIKFAFLVWLQRPSAEGAMQSYSNHLRPFFLRHQARVYLLLGCAHGEMVRLISTHTAEIKYVRTMLLKIIGSGLDDAFFSVQWEDHWALSITIGGNPSPPLNPSHLLCERDSISDNLEQEEVTLSTKLTSIHR